MTIAFLLAEHTCFMASSCTKDICFQGAHVDPQYSRGGQGTIIIITVVVIITV